VLYTRSLARSPLLLTINTHTHTYTPLPTQVPSCDQTFRFGAFPSHCRQQKQHTYDPTTTTINITVNIAINITIDITRVPPVTIVNIISASLL
jgi:hypothetical protein